MATSGVISSAMTVREVITRALTLLGIVPIDDTPAEEYTEDGITALNWMLKSLQTDGCHLFRQEEYTLTFTAGTQTQALSPRVLDVTEARRVVSSTQQLPLVRWELGEYVQIPNKAASGNILAYTLKKGVSAIEMTVWQVPSEATDVVFTGARVIEDVTSLDETLDLPQEWTEAIIYNLADRMIDTYSVELISPAKVIRIQQRAAILYQKLTDLDRPASIFFG